MNRYKMLSEAKNIRNQCVIILKDRGFVKRASRLETTTIKINTRTTVTAGRAWPLKNEIQLSAKIFGDIENEHGFENTVTHELAHLIAKFGHGSEWKNMHRLLGGDGQRCHNFKCERRSPQNTKFVTCPNCNERLEMGSRKYSNYMKGKAYRHNKCGGIVERKFGPDGDIMRKLFG